MKTIWEKFCTLSRSRQIALVVFFLHFVGVFTLSVHHLIVWKKPSKTKIAVRTVRPATPQRVAEAPQLAAQGPSTFSAPEPQKTIPTQKTVKATAPKKTAAAKKSPPQKGAIGEGAAKSPKLSASEESLLREIAENLEILSSDSREGRASSLLSLPAAIPKAVRIEETDSSDPSYGETLIAFLQSALDLPEYGDVRARLEISPSGQLAYCEIVEARNRKNGEFLKKRLPELAFPCFNEFGKSNEPLTFTVTFKNVENL